VPETPTPTFTEPERPSPARRSGKKPRIPLPLIIWGLVIAAAVVIILLIIKPGIDASSVEAPAYTAPPQSEQLPLPEDMTGETTAAPDTMTDKKELVETGEETAPAARLIVTVAENSPVYFAANLETLLPDESDKLDRILAGFQGLNSVTLTVFGHTAEANKPNAQFVLSAERAITIRDYLRYHNPGIILHITIIGRGANDPVITGKPIAEQAANRRAEIKVDKAE
jgi:outer membrane protein OmpA-like peptidoglycan-associated protein